MANQKTARWQALQNHLQFTESGVPIDTTILLELLKAFDAVQCIKKNISCYGSLIQNGLCFIFYIILKKQSTILIPMKENAMKSILI